MKKEGRYKWAKNKEIDNKDKVKTKKAKNNKAKDVPVIENPTTSVFGKVVIWIIIIAMIGAVLASLIYAIITFS